VASLPTYRGNPLREENADPSFYFHPHEPEGYVWPDIRSRNGNERAHVVLITAPGAMGKSVAAQAVANSLNASYVDLSRLTVGNHTFVGLLTRVLGWSQAPTFIEKLRSGENSVIMDALDEAQLRSGRDHTIAFLEDIAQILLGSIPAGQIVVFGRPDSMETAYLAFTEAQISVNYLSIEPLTYTQASELIDFTLDRKVSEGRPYEVHRTHPTPMADLRSAVFLDIAKALGAAESSVDKYWPQVEGFLGYPPVLLVLAERLAVENPAAEKSKLEAQTTSQSIRRARGELLQEIIEGILDREQQKFSRQIAPALGFDWDDPRIGVLYEREEQCLRVLERFSGINLNLPRRLSTRRSASSTKISFRHSYKIIRSWLIGNLQTSYSPTTCVRISQYRR
jgi:hypothetical protein